MGTIVMLENRTRIAAERRGTWLPEEILGAARALGRSRLWRHRRSNRMWRGLQLLERQEYFEPDGDPAMSEESFAALAQHHFGLVCTCGHTILFHEYHGWGHGECEPPCPCKAFESNLVLQGLGYDERERPANRDFAVAAHEALPDLLDALRDRDAEIAALRAALAPFAAQAERMPDWLEPETPLSSRVRYGIPPRIIGDGLTLAHLRAALAALTALTQKPMAQKRYDERKVTP
jgi:hypothetical protein